MVSTNQSLRLRIPTVRVWGIEPPGGLLSAELAEACRCAVYWCTSVQHGTAQPSPRQLTATYPENQGQDPRIDLRRIDSYIFNNNIHGVLRRLTRRPAEQPLTLDQIIPS